MRFERNSVQLAATYTLVPAEGGKEAAQHGVFTSSPRTWDGKDPGVLVGLLRDAAGELGDAIAVALTAAGGVGLLMQSLPSAQALVHPRGARHMIDPAALWQARPQRATSR